MPRREAGLGSRGCSRLTGQLAVLLALCLVLGTRPVASAQVVEPSGEAPSVGGVPLERTTVADRPLYYDPDVPPEVIPVAAEAIREALADVPRLLRLPPLSAPLAVHVLADQRRLRLALAELAQVRVDLLGEEGIGGYAIERGGTMLLFFPQQSLASPGEAAYTVTHELAHQAIREASAFRPIPQWLNEGYAERTAVAAARERSAEDAALLDGRYRSAIASALHTRGLLPWPELVNRSRFARAGREGLGTLAYGQSMLFVDWLIARHGQTALAEFLFEIGRGATPTAAFQSVMGPFSPQAEAFGASLASLPRAYPPGLHRLGGPAAPGRAVAFAVVGGVPGEPAMLDLNRATGPRHREGELDAAGYLYAEFEPPSGEQPAEWLIRVSTPSLGHLEADSTDESPAPRPREPRPAPVQLPRVTEVPRLPVGAGPAPARAA